jgi:predicted RNA-binding protein YlxR (DUF448 family)
VAGARGRTGDAEHEADDASVRLCAVSRTQRPPDELIRFVLAPDGAIVPDLARRLPGRGVWVSATRDAVASAVRQKVFAKSLKQAVTVPEELPGRVEDLMRRRLAEAISLANKAGLLVSGFAKVEGLLEDRRAAVVVHASDAAADGVSKLDRKFKALAGPDCAGQSTVAELTSAELSLAIGRSNVVHAAASEGGASRRIIEEASRLRRYRAGEGESPGPSCFSSESNTGRA